MDADVDEARSGGQMRSGMGGRRLGEENLSPVAQIANTSAPIDRRAVVVAVTHIGLTTVEPHADLEWVGRRPYLSRKVALNGDRGGYGLHWRREHGKAAVPFT